MNYLRIAFLFAALTLFSEAQLIAGWSKPVTLTSYADQSTNPNVAVSSTGYAIGVWSEYNGQNIKVRSSTHTTGAGWSACTYLTPDGINSYSPEIAMNASGNAIVVWGSFDGESYLVSARLKPFGGSWSDILVLSEDGANAANPKVSIDSIGNIIVVWEKYEGAAVSIQAIRRTYYGVWGCPEDISIPGEYAFQPQIVSNTTGMSVAVWTGFDGVNLYTEASIYDYGFWSFPEYLSEYGFDSMGTDVDINCDGEAIAVWSGYDGCNFTIQAAYLDSYQYWSMPMVISEDGQDAYNAQVAIDPCGNAVAVWTRNDGNNYIAQSSTLYSNYSATQGSLYWTIPVNLSASGSEAANPAIAVDPFGNAVAIWTRLNGSNFVLQAASLPFGSSWSAPQDLSDPHLDAVSPSVVIDGAGDATIIWAENFNYYVIQSVDGTTLF